MRGHHNPAAEKGRGPFLLLLCIYVTLFAAPIPSQAQAFKMQGGTSSLYHGHGGSLEMRGLNYTAQFNFGWLDGPRMGFSYATLYRGALINIGDQAIPFGLPTDLFNSSYYFLGRGASFSRKDSKRSLFVYGGATSKSYLLPFFRAADAETGTGLIFFEQQLSPKLRFFSQNVFSARQTSIQSLEWRVSDRFKLAASGGIGSNEPHYSTTLDMDRNWISVQAGYTVARSGFRRIRVETPSVSETDRENVRVEMRPFSNLQLIASRHNYLSPDQNSNRVLRATVNGYSASTNLRGLQLHGSFYDSINDSGRARALSFGGRRNFGNRLDISSDYLRGMPSSGAASSSLVTTLRETITPRLSLIQVVTLGNGQRTVAFGGQYNGNRFSAGVEYQTIYVPFAVGGDSPFKQVLVLNLRFLLPGFVELNVASDVSPLGQVRYTTYATGFAYRGVTAGSGGPGMSGGAVHPYVVQGTVVDQSGAPVRGAAIFIENELVFTDSRGYFSLRRKKAGDLMIAVALNEFILPGNYEVVSAPESAKAAREGDASEIRIVLRRLANKPVQERMDPNRLGVPNPRSAEEATMTPELPVLELSQRISTTSRDLSMALLPPISYKGRVSAAIPPASAKAAKKRSAQPVGTIWYWPANARGPVAQLCVVVRYANSGANAQPHGQRHAGSADPGNSKPKTCSPATFEKPE